MDSTFHHPTGVGWSPFLSRTGNVLHAFLRANIQELTFHHPPAKTGSGCRGCSGVKNTFTFLDCTQTVRSGQNTFLFNFVAGRNGWVIPSGKMPSGLYIAVRPEGIFLLGISQSPGPILISRQVFVLARNRYNSGSSLYFVRGGSEIISSDAVQNGKSPEIFRDRLLA